MSMNDRTAPDADLLKHRVQPSNVEAEQSVLSAVILDNHTLLEVLEILSPEDFYTRSHHMIFDAIMELFRRGEPIDLVTLSNILTQRGEIDQIVGENYRGVTYLSWLTDAAPMAVNAPSYARIVREKSNLRHMIRQAHEIIRRCYESDGDVDEVIDFAEKAVFDISEQKIRPSFQPLSRIIESNIDTLEERQGNKALITGVATGFSRLDAMTSGFQPSDLIILAARPSMGKNALTLNLARNAAVDSGVPVGIFSLEMSKEQLSMRMLCAEARVDSTQLRSGYFNDADWRKLTHAA